MGERKDVSSVASCSGKNNRDDVRKRKADDDAVSLPEGWEIRHSRSQNGRVYYVNSITKVSTWRHPCKRSDDQGRSTSEEKVKLKDPKIHLETKQPVMAVTQLKEKQVVSNMTASVRSNKRKAEKTSEDDPISNKVKKSSNISTVQNASQCQKQSDKTHGDKSEKWVAKDSLEKEYTAGSCNSARTKDQEHVFNCKAAMRDVTSQGEHIASQTDKTPVRQILKPSKKTSISRPAHDSSQNVSTNCYAAGKVNDTVPEYSNSVFKKTLTSVFNSVSSTLKGVSSSVNKSQSTNSSPVDSLHLVTTKKSTPELYTSDPKQNKGSHIWSHETLPRDRPSQCNDCSTNSDESCHQGNSTSLNKINMGLTPQTSPEHATHSLNFSSLHSQSCGNSNMNNSKSPSGGNSKIMDDSKSPSSGNSEIMDDSKSLNLNHAKCAVNSNLFRSSCHNSWLYSPDGTNWRATANTGSKLLNSQFVSCNAACNLNVSHDTTVWSPSPSGTEEEHDIEDMEVDEGLEILSNLQDVRTQTSSILQEPTGVLTETVTRAKSVNQCAAIDSTKDVLEKQVILVVDTNVFISCLKSLQEIMNCSIPGYQGVVLVMPWVVMQELDYLKNKRSSINNFSNSTSLRASNAVRFIHSHLTEENSQLLGQTPQEAAEKTDFLLENNDDRVLQCCLQFEKKYPGSSVVLLTRDMNLINKAVITGISAASNETLLSHLNIPKLQSGSRITSSTADTPNTRKRSLQNEDVKSVGKKLNDNAGTVSKKGTTTANETTPMRPVAKKVNLGLPNNAKSLSAATPPATPPFTPPVTPPATPASSKVSKEPRKLPQTDVEKAAVMDKFVAVWKLIHDMKSQIGVIVAAGVSHPNYSEAAKLLKGLRPLMLKLKDDFSRCLYLSPVILWEHEAEFAALCTRLNSFYAEAQTSCGDPSQQVESVQLLRHFHDSGNRSVLMTGLEQLSAFITDVEAMLKTLMIPVTDSGVEMKLHVCNILEVD